MDFVGVALGQTERVHAVSRLQHDVPLTAEDFARQRTHRVLVLDQQYGLPGRLPEIRVAATRLRQGRG